MERKFHGSESSLGGLFAPWNESAEVRKGPESLIKSLTGTLQYGPDLVLGISDFVKFTPVW